VGERLHYIQVWTPDNGRVSFLSIIAIWGGGTLWVTHKLELGERRSLASHYTLTTVAAVTSQLFIRRILEK